MIIFKSAVKQNYLICVTEIKRAIFQAYMFVGHVVISYAAGVVTALVFDFPFRNLKRIVQKKPLDTPY